MAIGMGIVSDDFTGGLMVASRIESNGTACPYIIDPARVSQIGDQDVVVVATRMRFMTAAAAVALLGDIASRLDNATTDQVFYKYCATFDSTDDGNIGPCADFLMQRYEQPALVFCPGFPDVKIYVHEGYMFYKDRLISESVKRFDPLTPMNDPDMARTLQRQTKHKVGLLPHRILHQGEDAVRAWLAEQTALGIDYFMMDSVDNEDVECGARVIVDWPAMTGGDALPIALAKLRAARGAATATRQADLSHAGGPGVVIAGSCGQETMLQLDHFEASHPTFRLDLSQVDSKEEATAEILEWATPRIGDNALAVTTAADPEGIAKAQKRYGRTDAARLAESILADVSVGLFERGVRRFVVSGGETSGAVVEALNVPFMRVLPFDDLGAGCCIAMEPAHLSFLLKPGKTGTADVFGRALARMNGPVPAPR